VCFPLLDSTLNKKITLYKEIYSKLYTSLKWKSDKRNLMLIAAMYVTSAKEFRLDSFLELADYIKSEVGMFSYLKSAQRFTTAATLDTTTDDSRAGFHRLTDTYEKLINNGFGRNPFSYIAAGALLKVNTNRLEEYIKKSSDVYKGMRNHHFFLTNSSDYPLAAILALNENNPEKIVSNVEEYYQALKEQGFSSGNDLQFMSHILALDANHQPNKKAERCLTVKNQLNHADIKIKKVYYPYIGMLSYLDTIGGEINTLLAIYENLNDDKRFKWNKEINFMLAVLFLMNQKTELGDAAKTGLNTTIEVLIQAQQAAMTASVTAASAASASSGGDS
jgi:hypothetical protein